MTWIAHFDADEQLDFPAAYEDDDDFDDDDFEDDDLDDDDLEDDDFEDDDFEDDEEDFI